MTQQQKKFERLKNKFFKDFDNNFYKDLEVGTRGGIAVALIWKQHPMEAKELLLKMFDELEKELKEFLVQDTQKGSI